MLEVKNLTKIYKPKKGVPVKALNGINLNIEEHGMVFILGKSGSGKSTLLNLLGGLDKYNEGEIIIKGKSSKDFSQSEFDSYRNTYVGFIFQEYNILNEFSVGANIALAMELQGKKATSEVLNKLLETVDLAGYASRKPNELSGGQKQRVAIARALIKDPEIIMADEPTGALDSNTGKQVFETLKKLSKDKLVVIVSHDREFAEYYGDRVIELADGKIISDICKFKTPSDSKSEGVSVIDNKILHIKQGYELTEEDLFLINNYLRNNQNDTIISVDPAANTDFKKLARIDDEGNRDSFKKTVNERLKIKKYKESEFKLIRSKLPTKNAFKIGASSLKSKPFRLFITILLSAIAFALFGLADTMGSYDKITATTNSIIDSNINYLSISKEIKMEYSEKDYYFNSTNLGDEDLEKISEEFPDLNLIPVYGSSGNYYSNYSFENFKDESEFPETFYISFYTKSFSGFAEVTQADLTAMGFTLKAGTVPLNNNDILVPYYIYEHFKVAGWENPSNSGISSLINTEADLVGKAIEVNMGSSQETFNICGVVDTNFDDSRYASFKTTSTDTLAQTDLTDMIVAMELNSVLKLGPHAIAFVKEGFVDANLDTSTVGSYAANGNNYNISGLIEVGGNDQYFSLNAIYDLEDISSTDTIHMLNGETRSAMGANDVIIDVNSLIGLSTSSINISSDIFDIAHQYALDILSGAPSAEKNVLEGDFKTYLVSKGYPADMDDSNLAYYYANYYQGMYNGYSENTTEFIHPLSYFFNQAFEDCVDTLKAGVYPEVDLQIDSYTSSSSSNKKTYNIVGFCVPATIKSSYNPTVYLTTAGIDNIGVELTKINPYSFVLAEMPSTEAEITKIVTFTYGDQKTEDEIYPLNNSITAVLSQVNSLIEGLASIFLYIGIGFAVFASFLMMNFISTSISYKKREIGILRAVGARSNDVFGIFFSESFLIACINWLFALVLTVGTVLYLNNMLRADYNLQITLLNIGLRQIGLIFGVSVAVAFIASFLPVQKIARKKPIDAIQNR